MHEAAWPLASWEVFYLIVGAAAAALTGLQFVVIVLAVDLNALAGIPAIRAFVTPTIVHFSAALLVSALVTAPWRAPLGPSLGLATCGAAGFAYGILIVRRMRRQTVYVPDLEDWTWHGVLPLVAYGALIGAAIFLSRYAEPSLFVIGATAALLLFIGIHNAWDSVVYIALRRIQPPAEERGQPPLASTGDTAS